MDVVTLAARTAGVTVSWTEASEIGSVDFIARRTTSGQWAVRATEDLNGTPRELEMELWDTHAVERHSELDLCKRSCCRY